MVKWGSITERDGLNKLINIIAKMSKSQSSDWVTPEDLYDPLRKYVKSKNPRMKNSKVDKIASNMRGWLGSRYTMFSKRSTHYVDIKKLLSFIEDFERSKRRGKKAYNYRRKPESVDDSLNSIAKSFINIEHELEELETKGLRGIRDKRINRLEKALHNRISDAHGTLGELWKSTNSHSLKTSKRGRLSRTEAVKRA